MKAVALLLGLVLLGSGAAVLRALPKVSAKERRVLRGVAIAQMIFGAAAALLAGFTSLI
jgi:hypothetical protein